MFKGIIFKNVFIAAIVVNVITALLPLLLKSVLPPITPILFGRPYGETQLTPVIFLSAVPVFFIIITALNFFTASRVGDVFIKKTLAISSLFISILVAIAILKVIFLVGFF